MKKEYIKPEIQVYEIDNQQILSASLDFNNEQPLGDYNDESF